jgi:hypothetical protein
VAECAARALRDAAGFLDIAATGEQEAAAASARHRADVCRRIAAMIASHPSSSIRAVLRPDDLEGRFETGTECVHALADAACWLLRETAAAMRDAWASDGVAANSLRELAYVLERAARLLELAPNAEFGTRLRECLPYLQKLHSGENALPPGPGGLTEIEDAWLDVPGLLAEPRFHALARDCCRMRDGRDLDEMPSQMREVWSASLAGYWRKRNAGKQSLRTPEMERLDHAVRHPRFGWASPPLMRGSWRELSPADAMAVLALIGQWHRVGDCRVPFPLAHACDRVRTRQLACYDGALLVEVQGMSGNGRVGIASFLLADDGVHAIDGRSLWLHERNELFGTGLDGPDAWLDYLRLFATRVHADEGAFWPLESADDLLARALDVESVRTACASHAHPIRPCGYDEEGRRLFSTAVCYGQGLYESVFALAPDGLLEMVDDRPLAAGLPLRVMRMDGLFLVATNPQ